MQWYQYCGLPVSLRHFCAFLALYWREQEGQQRETGKPQYWYLLILQNPNVHRKVSRQPTVPIEHCCSVHLREAFLHRAKERTNVGLARLWLLVVPIHIRFATRYIQ
jgi:hypothetical protein